MADEWKPKIIGIICNWCSYAGTEQTECLYPAVTSVTVTTLQETTRQQRECSS